MRRFAFLLAAAVTITACGPGSPGGPSMNNRMTATQTTASQSVESREILEREPRANRTKVKHILISWKDKAAGSMGARADERALGRTKLDAERQVRALEQQIAAGADFDTLMKSHSEDKGSAAEAESYEVSPDAQLVIEFRQLGLRLDVGEVGVVESDFGFHIIKRVE